MIGKGQAERRLIPAQHVKGGASRFVANSGMSPNRLRS
jgi:hypothetical protein